MIKDDVQIGDVNVQIVSAGTVVMNVPATEVWQEIPDDDEIVGQAMDYAIRELGITVKEQGNDGRQLEYKATTGEGVILIMPDPVFG